jgi:hypothetical protein
VKTVKSRFRDRTISIVLMVALSAASTAPMVGPAYASNLDGDDGVRKRAHADHDSADKEPSFIAALSNECPDILAYPSEYDDTLIALCLKGWRRP